MVSSHPGEMRQTPGALRPVRSAESLVPVLEVRPDQGDQVQVTPLSAQSGGETVDSLGPLEAVTKAVSELRRERDSPKCHSRSSSHDSYFERKLSVQFRMEMDDEPDVDMSGDVSVSDIDKDVSPSPKMKVDSSLDISEIQMNFDLEDNEMKIFSEDEAMMSTSVGSELSLTRSPLEEGATPVTPSYPLISRGSTQRQNQDTDPLESPTKSRRMSFKEKFKKFTSPTLSRKQNPEPSKMIDSGVGFDSDSCSGSFETKSFDDSKKPTKLKEKIVSALSPESLRKKSETPESSPKKKKSASPNVSPSVRSLIKRSKIEDESEEISRINLSPSIKFIDASSSYELGLGLSSETLDDTRVSPRADDDTWHEGAETVRENAEVKHDVSIGSDQSVVEVQVHEPIESHEPEEDSSVIVEEVTGPISIIGASVDTEAMELEKTSLLSQAISCDTMTNDSRDKNMTEDANLAQDIFSLNSQTSDETPAPSLSSKDGSEMADSSVSYAGATVSENESFSVQSYPESTNDEENEEDTDDKTETIKSVIAAQADAKKDVEEPEATLILEERAEEECEETCPSITAGLERHDDGAEINQEKFAMEIDDDDKNLDLNKQKVDDEVETEDVCCNEEEEEEESPMETDMTILSAEISANKRLYEKSENKTVFNDFYLHYESDSDKEESSESHIESNTSERSECPAVEVETSAQTSGQPSPLDTPQLVLGNKPDLEEKEQEDEEEGKLNTEENEASDQEPATAETADLVLDLGPGHTSPGLEVVMMRHSPSSPARNRSVRSDFLSNFMIESPDQGANPVQDIPSPQLDIGRPPLPKTTPPKFTGIAKALSPQPYNKPVSSDSQSILSSRKYSRPAAPEPLMFTAECTVRSSPSPQLLRRELPEPVTLSLNIQEQESEQGGEEAMKIVTDGMRHQSLSPGPASLDNSMDCCEAETESLASRGASLEPEMTSSPGWEESGRRSTQGIPEVSHRDTLCHDPQPDVIY